MEKPPFESLEDVEGISPSAEDVVARKELLEYLDERLKTLAYREEEVLRARIFEDKTLKEVGLGLSHPIGPEQVRAIQNKALKKLRSHGRIPEEIQKQLEELLG